MPSWSRALPLSHTSFTTCHPIYTEILELRQNSIYHFIENAQFQHVYLSIHLILVICMTTRIYCSLRWRCTSNQSTILVAGQLAVPLQTGRSYVCKSTQIRHRSSSWLHWLYLMRKVCSEDPVRRRIITLPYLHQKKDGLH